MAVLALYPGCIYHEVATATYLFSDYEKVYVAGPTTDPIVTGDGLRIVPDITYADARVLEEKTLMLPGGDCYEVFENESLLDLIMPAASPRSIFSSSPSPASWRADCASIWCAACFTGSVSRFAPSSRNIWAFCSFCSWSS